MNTYNYNTRQILPITIEQAWDFFSSPGNLVLITPPSLDFKITAMPKTTEIFEGMIIDYKLRPLLGLATRWKTIIATVRKPYCFVDCQLAGPYRFWEHTHGFVENDKGVVVTDELKYQLPLGFLGRLAHTLAIRKKIQNIFEYRRLALQKIFSSNEHTD